MRIVLVVLGLGAIVAGCVSSGASPQPSAISSPGSVSASTGPTGSPRTTPNATVDPDPSTPLPSASPSSNASADPGSTVRWRPVGSVETQEEWPYASGLIGFADGYLALVGSLWYSEDGRSWRTVGLPAPDPIIPPASVGPPDTGGPVAIATDGQTLVVVGWYGREPCDWERANSGETGGDPICSASPVSWVSTDGLHWRSSLPWVGPTGIANENFSSGSAFSAVWWTPQGWEAWLCYPTGSVCANREVWASSDGLVWAHRSDMLDIDGEWGPPLTVVGAGGLRLAASSGFMRRSTDGVTWTDVSFPGETGSLQAGVGSTRSGEPWVLSSAIYGPTIWLSSDLATWEQARLPGADRIDGGPSSLIRASLGYVAIARDWSSTSGPTWLSPDGTTWTTVPGTTGITALADGPAGVIGIGLATDGGDLPVYDLR